MSKPRRMSYEEEIRAFQPYKDWHRDLGKECPVFDVDQIECRYDPEIHHLKPAALLELTTFRDGIREEDREEYARRIRKDWSDCFRRTLYCRIAALLKAEAYLVLFEKDLSLFWVIPIRSIAVDSWKKMSRQEYETWLRSL